jgi:hypothetical protein
LMYRLESKGIAKQLRPSSLRVYIHLASRMNGLHFEKTGEVFAWPKQTSIMKRTGLKLAMLNLAIGELKRNGLLERVRRNVPTRRRDPERLFDDEENWKTGYLLHAAQDEADGVDSPSSREQNRRSGKRKLQPVRVSDSDGARATLQPVRVSDSNGARAVLQPVGVSNSNGARAVLQPVGVSNSNGARAVLQPVSNEQVLHSLSTAHANEAAADEGELEEAAAESQARASQQLTHETKHAAVALDGTGIVLLLVEKYAIDKSTAEWMTSSYSLARLKEVIELAEVRKSRGKCDNPGGFIREALEREWPVPPKVAARTNPLSSQNAASTPQTTIEQAGWLNRLRKEPADVLQRALTALATTAITALDRARFQIHVEDLLNAQQRGGFEHIHDIRQRVVFELNDAPNRSTVQAADPERLQVAIAAAIATAPATMQGMYSRMSAAEITHGSSHVPLGRILRGVVVQQLEKP